MLISVDPPIPPLSGLTKKTAVFETAVKEVIIYNQEKTYSGLENQLSAVVLGGRWSAEEQYWGDNCKNKNIDLR